MSPLWSCGCHWRHWERRLLALPTVPLSYLRPANMEVPVGEGRVSQITVDFQAGGPDLFQQEGIWLVKDKERTPVKRLTRVRILFRTSQLASEVYSPLPGPHSESRTVCGQRERPPLMAVSLSSVPSRYLALRCPSRGEQPHGGALSN